MENVEQHSETELPVTIDLLPDSSLGMGEKLY